MTTLERWIVALALFLAAAVLCCIVFMTAYLTVVPC